MPPHTGMSVQVGLASSVDMYLRQWLKVASGDRVYLFQHTSGMMNSYTVFKCRTCGDNWHVVNENFEGTQIPQTLKDWVTKHRHVCSKFNGPGKTTGTCKSCGWPYGAHEESWMAKTPTNDPGNDGYGPFNGAEINDPQDGIDAWEYDLPQSTVKWMLLPVKDGDKAAAIVKATSKSLQEFTGRKFRDVE